MIKAPLVRLALSLFMAAFVLIPASAAADDAPFVLARAKQYDMHSKINGQTYRIMVTTPRGDATGKTAGNAADSGPAYPVLYVLDGDRMFATASEIATELRAEVIVVGIGYGTDNGREWGARRALDMTPSAVKGNDLFTRLGWKSGGGDAFLRVLEEEVKPFVSTRYRVDSTKQILFGKSLGGLITLRALFRNPTAYAGYVVSSPSIWVNNREILNDEAAFSKRARAGELRLRILVTSAGEEQYRGDDPKLLAADTARMIDNATELADRLKALNPAKISVSWVIFPGETHVSVSSASISRAVRFAASLK
jgi:uncharacterized protein